MGDFSVHGKIHKGLYLPSFMMVHDDCVQSVRLSIFTVKSAFVRSVMMLILAVWRRPILTCCCGRDLV